ncbi:MAG: 3-deoxy-D-manno-octulosonic acid transferase [Planctomycetota bacterium]|nr:3-deoxy-D-manno-octulosonic acid transferase [Planctomycetota bacterium]
MGIILDTLYAAALTAASPVWLYKMIRHGRYREDVAQRFGAVPTRYGLQPTIWVHAVSLGEINAARTLVAQLHSQLPDYRVVVSTSTDTGMAAARRLFATDHMVFRWPLDFTLAVRRAIARIRPAMVVLMEGEVWPNFLAACQRKQIPVAVVNARMSPDKGYPGYKKLGPLAARLLFNRLRAIGVQSEDYAARFRDLGTDPARLHVTGMMKFDTIDTAESRPGQAALAAAMGIAPDDDLLVAGGTGDGEEKLLLEIYPALRAKHPRLKLAIVPRKPERFEEVARQIAAAGLGVIRRSQTPDGSTGPQDPAAVILGDTMGELRTFYALARCVFVGRSLVPMGGSDMIEAAAMGKPTAFGPHTFNFPQADDLAGHGCSRVADAGALAAQIDAWLGDRAAADQAGHDARRYVLSQQGATRRNVDMICHILGRTPALREGDVATEQIREA